MIDLKRSSVYSLITIYKKFIEELECSPEKISVIDYSKLVRILPILDVQSVGHKDWIEKAKSISRKELEEEIRAFNQERAQRERLPKPSSSDLPELAKCDSSE